MKKESSQNIERQMQDREEDPAGLSALDVLQAASSLRPPIPPRNIREAIERKDEFVEYQKRKVEVEELIDTVYRKANDSRKDKLKKLKEEDDNALSSSFDMIKKFRNLASVFSSMLRLFGKWIVTIIGNLMRFVVHAIGHIVRFAIMNPIAAAAILAVAGLILGLAYAYKTSKDREIDVIVKTTPISGAMERGVEGQVGVSPPVPSGPGVPPVEAGPVVTAPIDVSGIKVENFFNVQDVIMAGDPPPEHRVTPEQNRNMQDLLSRVNPLLSIAKQAGIDFKKGKLNSGLRSAAKVKAQGLSKNSAHNFGMALDVGDASGKLDKFVVDNPGLLDKFNLYVEDPRATKTWTHFQTKKPRSGNRIFAVSQKEYTKGWDPRFNANQVAAANAQSRPPPKPVGDKQLVKNKQGQVVRT